MVVRALLHTPYPVHRCVLLQQSSFYKRMTYCTLQNSPQLPKHSCNRILRAVQNLQTIEPTKLDAIFKAGDLNSHNFVAIVNCLGKNHNDFSKVVSIWRWMKKRGIKCDEEHYSAMIKIYAETEKWNGMYKTIQEMKQAVKLSKTLADIYSSIFKSLYTESQMEKIFRILQQVQNEEFQPYTVTYRALISAMRKSWQWQEILEFFWNMQREGLHIDIKTYNELIGITIKESMLEQVTEIFDKMQKARVKPNIKSYNMLLYKNELEKQKKKRKKCALEIFRVILNTGMQPNLVTYKILINTFAKTCDWKITYDVFRTMKNFNLSPDYTIYIELIRILLKDDQWEIALQIFSQMLIDGFQPDSKISKELFLALQNAGQQRAAMEITYNILLCAMLKDSHWTKALELVQEMSSEGLKPNNVTHKQIKVLSHAICKLGNWQKALEICKNATNYNALSRALYEEGKWEQVMELGNKLIEDGLKPNKHMLIHTMQNEGHHKDALKLFEKMKKKNNKMFQLNVTAYTMFLMQKAIHGLKALSFFEKILKDNVKPKTLSYYTLFIAIHKDGNWKKVSKLLSKMKYFERLAPEKVTREHIKGLIHAMYKQGRWKKALKIFKDATSYNVLIRTMYKEKDWSQVIELRNKKNQKQKNKMFQKPDVVTNTIILMQKARYGQKVFRFFEKILKDNVVSNTLAYTPLLIAMQKDGNWKKALELVQKMQDEELKYNTMSPSQTALLLQTIHKQARWQKWDQVIELGNKFIESGFTPNTVLGTILIRAMQKGGHHKDALKLFDKMRKKKNKKFQPNIITYNIILTHKARNAEEALKFFEKMLKDNVKPCSITYHLLILAMHKGELWEIALELIQKMQNGGVKPDNATLNEIKLLIYTMLKQGIITCEQFKLLIKQGMIKPDITTVKEIKLLIKQGMIAREQIKPFINAMAKQGHRQKALEIFKDAPSYNVLVNTMFKDGKWGKVTELVSKMVDDGLQPNAQTYHILIHMMQNKKDLQKLLKLFQNMQKQGMISDIRIYNFLIIMLSNAGKFNKALEIIEKMKENGLRPRITTYNTLVKASQDAGEWEKALEILVHMKKMNLKPDSNTKKMWLLFFRTDDSISTNLN